MTSGMEAGRRGDRGDSTSLVIGLTMTAGANVEALAACLHDHLGGADAAIQHSGSHRDRSNGSSGTRPAPSSNPGAYFF